MSKWDEDPEERIRVGKEAEDRWKAEKRCICGKAFIFTGDRGKGWPDFQCPEAHIGVEVKATPSQSGNIAISKDSWEKADPETLYVTPAKKGWVGKRRRDIYTLEDEARPTAHHSTGTHLGNLDYYLVPCQQLFPVEWFGIMSR